MKPFETIIQHTDHPKCFGLSHRRPFMNLKETVTRTFINQSVSFV